MRTLSLLAVLCLVAGSCAEGSADGELLLRVLTKLTQQTRRSVSPSECSSTSQGGRDPAQTLTLAQPTLDDINDFLAHSLHEPLDLLGLEVPTLDPLVVDRFAVASDDASFGKINITMNGVNITDLSTIQLRSVKLNILEPPLNLQISLAAEDVVVKSEDYYINLTIADTFSVYGYGNMWFNISGINLYADIDLNGLSLSGIHINDLVVSIEKFDSYFENLMGGGDTGTLVNEVINSIMPDLMTPLADALKDLVNRGGQPTNATESPPQSE